MSFLRCVMKSNHLCHVRRTSSGRLTICGKPVHKVEDLDHPEDTTMKKMEKCPNCWKEVRVLNEWSREKLMEIVQDAMNTKGPEMDMETRAVLLGFLDTESIYRR